MQSLLFFIIFLEGYVVLASELVAIRQMTPVAGTGTDIIAIIIAAVLMPLAFGYDRGGRYSPPKGKDPETSIRLKLAINFLTAGLFLSLGLSGFFIKYFFTMLADALPDDTLILQVIIYAATFLVIPTYLLAQTIPLSLKLLKDGETSKITGRVLCYSTFGSFMGSVFTTIILMMTIGVYNTVIVILAALTLLTLLILPKKLSLIGSLSLIPLIAGIVLNGPHIKQQSNILSDNAYNTVQIFNHPDDPSTRIMALDNAYSAGLRKDYPVFPYIVFIEDTFILPIENQTEHPKKDILIIGAGGFTIGLYDTHHNYSYVDIDPKLKEIAEDHFIFKELEPNKTFYPKPIRQFLNELPEDRKFDLIVLDVFRGRILPEALTTQEFFSQMKSRLKPNARLAMNLMICPNLTDTFSRNIDATVRSVFPSINYFLLGPETFNYDGWKTYARENGFHCATNGMYTYFHYPEPPEIYTDNLNRSALDY